MSLNERYLPTQYRPLRIALEADGEGGIVATADFQVFNAAGDVVGVEHPTVTLTAGEQSTFLAWFNGKLAEYEAATGLTKRGG